MAISVGYKKKAMKKLNISAFDYFFFCLFIMDEDRNFAVKGYAYPMASCGCVREEERARKKNKYKMVSTTDINTTMRVKNKQPRLQFAPTIADEDGPLVVPSLKQLLLQQHPRDGISRRLMDQIAHGPSNGDLIVLNLPAQCLSRFWSPI
jgi:hypothetical protein